VLYSKKSGYNKNENTKKVIVMGEKELMAAEL